ncbi:unnamed protein product, partial [Pylaiella littoralis]
FQGTQKHIIPGMDKQKYSGSCHNDGPLHCNSFGDNSPCKLKWWQVPRRWYPPTRERLEACIWDTSARCLPYLPSVNPDVRRSIVVFREPRDVILSSYKMRVEVLQQPAIMEKTLEEYIRGHFENLVSWIHQRWVWHTSTVFAQSSH